MGAENRCEIERDRCARAAQCCRDSNWQQVSCCNAWQGCSNACIDGRTCSCIGGSLAQKADKPVTAIAQNADEPVIANASLAENACEIERDRCARGRQCCLDSNWQQVSCCNAWQGCSNACIDGRTCSCIGGSLAQNADEPSA